MNEQDVKRMWEMMDEISTIAHAPKLSDIVNKMQDKIPAEMRNVVLDEVRLKTAEAIAEGMTKVQHEMKAALNDEDLLAKLKGLGPQEE